MKRISVLLILFVSFLFVSNNVKGQFNYIGGGVALTTGGEYDLNGLLYYNNTFGIDLRASYDYSKKLKIVPDFKFYLPIKEEFMTGGESKATVFVLNINAHYILNPKARESYRLYLLAGAHVGGWKINDNRVALTETLDVNEFKIVPGGNVGAGMQFKLSNRLHFFAEAKFVIAKSYQLVFNPGILYNI